MSSVTWIPSIAAKPRWIAQTAPAPPKAKSDAKKAVVEMKRWYR